MIGQPKWRSLLVTRMHSNIMCTDRLWIAVGGGGSATYYPTYGGLYRLRWFAFLWHCGNTDSPVNRQTPVKTSPILRVREVMNLFRANSESMK